ncbi:MAG: LD-carboxypeptidase [Rhodothermales bacterium]
MSLSRRAFLAAGGSAALAAPALATSPLMPETRPTIKPNRLRPGDTVGIVSPAGVTYHRVQIEILQEVIEVLGLKMKAGAHMLDRWGYLAGRDEDRAADINAMFADPEVDAIFALAGGWGSGRTLPYLDFELIRTHPKIFLGYSDITALLLAIQARTGLVAFHGPNGNSRWNTYSTDYLKRLLFEAEPVRMTNPTRQDDTLVQMKDRVHVITPGQARGRLLGGNLTVLTSIIGSPFVPAWEGSILFVEDIDEDVYRIDRMLTQLKLAGVLDQLAGFVFGKCTDCEPDSGYASFTLEDVLEQHIKPLGIPAWSGAMIGHIDDRFTVPVGLEAAIDAASGQITLLEAAVV